MVDTLCFLKNDYSEDEIYRLIEEINTYVTFFGGYYAELLKTTNFTIYREVKENFEVPEEKIIDKLPKDLLAIYQKLEEKAKKSDEEYDEYLHSAECRKMKEVWSSIVDNYITEHDGYNTVKYEPNKYVILARLNMGAYRDMAKLLDNMGIEYTDIVQWWGKEFDEKTAFKDTNYLPKELEIKSFNFWFDGDYSDVEIKKMNRTLTKALQDTRYGLYDHLYILRANSDVIVNVPVPNEYDKFEEYRMKTYRELIDEIDLLDPNYSELYDKGLNIAEERIAEYKKLHRIFDERAIKKGQVVISFSIMTEDLEEVTDIMKNAGYPLSFFSPCPDENLPRDTFDNMYFLIN